MKRKSLTLLSGLTLLISLTLLVGCSSESKAEKAEKAEMSDDAYCQSLKKAVDAYYKRNMENNPKTMDKCKVVDLIEAPGRFNKLVADVTLKEFYGERTGWVYQSIRWDAKVNKKTGETVEWRQSIKNWW